MQEICIKYTQKDNINDCITVSGDLKKVIMLPKAEMFKKIIFTKRTIAYHQSYALDRFNSNIKLLACI